MEGWPNIPHSQLICPISLNFREFREACVKPTLFSLVSRCRANSERFARLLTGPWLLARILAPHSAAAPTRVEPLDTKTKTNLNHNYQGEDGKTVGCRGVVVKNADSQHRGC